MRSQMYMKKLTIIFLSCLLALSFASCSKHINHGNGSSYSTSANNIDLYSSYCPTQMFYMTKQSLLSKIKLKRKWFL